METPLVYKVTDEWITAQLDNWVMQTT